MKRLLGFSYSYIDMCRSNFNDVRDLNDFLLRTLHNKVSEIRLITITIVDRVLLEAQTLRT